MLSEQLRQGPVLEGEQSGGDQGLNVVLGAENPLGWVLTERLASESRRVKAVFLERVKLDSTFPQVEKVGIDPTKAGSMVDACKGGSIVYDCYEPGYASRKEIWSQVTSNAVLAAIEVSATLVFASHLLNSESENGHMEDDILRTHQSNLTRTVVARVPQLFGIRVVNPLWKMIYDSVLSNKKAHWVGDSNIPRSFLDVEDGARAMIQLAQSADTYGRAWNIAGPEAITGTQFIELAFTSAGRKPKVGNWGRGVVLTGGFLSSDARGMSQMPYDYYSPFVLDASKFSEAFPSFQFATPEESVSRGIEWYQERVHS